MYIVHIINFTITMFNVQYIVHIYKLYNYNVQCAMYNVHIINFTITMFNVQCTMYTYKLYSYNYIVYCASTLYTLQVHSTLYKYIVHCTSTLCTVNYCSLKSTGPTFKELQYSTVHTLNI